MTTCNYHKCNRKLPKNEAKWAWLSNKPFHGKCQTEEKWRLIRVAEEKRHKEWMFRIRKQRSVIKNV
jgi:hypothetical protein